MEDDPLVGKTFGIYRIERKLGEGGMGAVYKALHATLERPVAFKILPQRLVKGNQQFIQRFLVEAKAAAKVLHPNIVQVFDAGEVEGTYFIAMEYVKGRDLREVLSVKSPLSESEALEMVLQAAQGLRAAAKENIIHRDIKPANFMMTEDGTVKVADFGLAKNLGATEHLTQSGQIMGTPAYMSPEQAEGQKTDLRSDIYSLGVTLFEMATGTKPFWAETAVGLLKQHCTAPVPDPLERRTDLNPSMKPLLLKMLAKNPEERYQDYDSLIRDMQKLKRESDAGQGDEAPVQEQLSTLYVLLDKSLPPAHDSTPSPVTAGASTPTPGTISARETTPAPTPTPTAPTMQAAPRSLLPLWIGLGAVALFAAVIGILFAAGVFSAKDTGGGGPQVPADEKDKAANCKKLLAQASAREGEGKLDEALGLVEQALAMIPGDMEAAEAKARLDAAIKRQSREDASGQLYRTQMAAAESKKATAEMKDGAADWAEVLAEAKKAQALKETEECKALVAFAGARHGLALARESEKAGRFDEALDLATKAEACGADIPALREFLASLKSRKDRIERKKRFEDLSRQAAAEQVRGEAGEQRALELWKEALEAADDSGDRNQAEFQVREIGKAISVRGAKRAEEEALRERKRRFDELARSADKATSGQEGLELWRQAVDLADSEEDAAKARAGISRFEARLEREKNEAEARKKQLEEEEARRLAEAEARRKLGEAEKNYRALVEKARGFEEDRDFEAAGRAYGDAAAVEGLEEKFVKSASMKAKEMRVLLEYASRLDSAEKAASSGNFTLAVVIYNEAAGIVVDSEAREKLTACLERIFEAEGRKRGGPVAIEREGKVIRGTDFEKVGTLIFLRLEDGSFSPGFEEASVKVLPPGPETAPPPPKIEMPDRLARIFRAPEGAGDQYGNPWLNQVAMAGGAPHPMELWLPLAREGGSPEGAVEFVLIPDGRCCRGSEDFEEGHSANEAPAHAVVLSRPFYISKYEITNKQFRALSEGRAAGDDRNPATGLSWDDCAAWCEGLSKKTGAKFQLPTEAQWEYACRAGSDSPLVISGDLSRLSALAWFNCGNVKPVGGKAANEWGLYDMLGNAEEWCRDWFAPYSSGEFTDPAVTDKGEFPVKVLRGGSARSVWRKVRPAARNAAPPSEAVKTAGFRVVFELGE